MKLRHWAYERQCLGRQGGTPAQVLKTVVGVYSAHPMGPLSLWARCRRLDDRSFLRLSSGRSVVRVPAMRFSAYLIPAASVAAVMGATLPPADDPFWEARYSVKGRAISKARYQSWTKKVLKAAGVPVTAQEIEAATGIPNAQVKPVLNRMAFERLLLRVGADRLRSNAIRYVSAKKWLGSPIKRIEPAKARAWLAAEYLRAFGPARVKDFQWWSGVTATEARKAFEALRTVDVGKDLHLLAKDLPAFESFRKPAGDRLDLLPQWDCYSMGYAPDGRERLVTPDAQGKLFVRIGATPGNALGAVLVNGEAHGTWQPVFRGTKMIVTLKMFGKPTSKVVRDTRKRLEEAADFLGAGTIEIKTG